MTVTSAVRHLCSTLPPPRRLRLAGPLALLAMLSACAGSHHPQLSATQEAALYESHARRSYVPPGPPGDPWGPYISEASARFDVPDAWIRAVIGQESGGQLYHSGVLVTSPVGAMGLMQLMPETYDEVRAKYGMGDDAYDPHNNILAGTAYIREMYDVFGTPGFLAAYNGGPARLDDYLMHHRPLPHETRRYVAMVGPEIAGIYPQARSDADVYATNQISIDTPDPRPLRRVLLAQAQRRDGRARAATRLAYARLRAPIVRESGERESDEEVAMLPEPPREPAGHAGRGRPSLRNAVYAAAPQAPRGPRRVSSALAAERAPSSRGGAGNWAIQVGAFGNPGQAQAALGAARGQARLGAARTAVAGVNEGHGKLYRARLTGLSRAAATQACQRLSHGRSACIVVSPDARS